MYFQVRTHILPKIALWEEGAGSRMDFQICACALQLLFSFCRGCAVKRTYACKGVSLWTEIVASSTHSLASRACLECKYLD